MVKAYCLQKSPDLSGKLKVGLDVGEYPNTYPSAACDIMDLNLSSMIPVPTTNRSTTQAYDNGGLVYDPVYSATPVSTSRSGIEEGAMKASQFSSLVLSLFILLLTSGLGIAARPQSRKTSGESGMTSVGAANAPWLLDEIDTQGYTGQHVSVAYHEDLDTIFISYYDATYQRLRLARSDGLPPEECGMVGDWGCMTLDSGPDVGKYSSIAVNPVTGGIGIAYYDATNGHLKYIVFENPRLLVHQTYTIDKGITDISWTGLFTSLKYSEDGMPHIAYYFENPNGVDALMLAYHSVVGNCGYDPPEIENTWSCHTIISGEGMGQYPSLAVTTAPWGWAWYISFYNAASGDLWYVRPAMMDPPGNCGIYGDDMACYPVDSTGDVGMYSSLYLDSVGDFHIAYYDATNLKLKYAYEQDDATGNCGVLGSAQCDRIDDMHAVYNTAGISIAEDLNGYPVIAYQSADGSLNLARPLAALGWSEGTDPCGPEEPLASWNCQTIDRSGFWVDYHQADYVSLAITPSGLVTIAYNEYIYLNDGNLGVAYQRFQVFMPLIVKDQ